MSNNIRERVINVLKENLGEESNIDSMHPDEDLSVLGVNSVTFIKLVIAVEMEFGIEWLNEDLGFQSFSTINKIVEYVLNSNIAS